MSETPPTSSTNTSASPSYTRSDLTDLVKAIKFAYPDYGIRKVHREIIEVASQQETSLQHVSLGEIKTIWKKAGLSKVEEEKETTKKSNSISSDSILKFYTVGDGSIQSVTQSYEQAAKDAIAAEAAKMEEMDSGEWYHFHLNVPADRSGTKPHQALINFSDSTTNPQQNAQTKNDPNNNPSNNRKEDLVKIQVAASIPGYSDMPMLLYNSDRSIRTFLHPPSSKKEKDNGYQKIKQLITKRGNLGALGQSGGTKGYFKSRIYKEQNVVSIDVSELAPTPSTW